MPLVSIITAAYNAEKYITYAIESVLSQTFKDWEFFIVDDGSTDDTFHKIEPYLNQLTYLRQENQGQAAARNHAYRFCKGKYIAILDSDDCWLPDKLFKQVEIIEKDQNLGLIYTNINYIDKKGNLIRLRVNAQDISRDPLYCLLLYSNPMCHSSILFNRKFLDPEKIQDESILHCDEYLTHLKVALRSGRFGYIPDKLTYYRVHLQSLAQSESYKDYLKGALYALEIFFQLPDIPQHYKKLKRKAIGRFYLGTAQSSIDKNIELIEAAKNLLISMWYRPSFILSVMKQFMEMLYRASTSSPKKM